ncbi:hypothetical protein BD410DRAFT_842089 [Rickenella mellea]|uniref:Uncharacterized protein n=1 Tax=Rickenella mellea TaxID=50990 RepID=A0A4Y7PVC2_9AGAM|nr:hypothetical protein BD410DRAFT_842089 [Rickenella mellea]
MRTPVERASISAIWMEDNVQGSTLGKSQSVADLIRDRIVELESNPDSLLRKYEPDEFKFRFDTNSKNGTWADRTNKRVKNITLIVPLLESLDEYADLTHAADFEFVDSRISKAKWRVIGVFPPSIHLPPDIKSKLKLQFKNLVLIQQAHQEAWPTQVKINNFVKAVELSGEYHVAMVTAPAWRRATGTSDAMLQGLLEEEGEKNDEEEEEDDASGDGTLASWPDPLGKFEKLSHKTLKGFKVNTDINAFDCNDEWVHPTDYGKVFRKGVWITADVSLKLWDMTGSRRGGGSEPSRTYQVSINQIKALSEGTYGADPAKKTSVSAGSKRGAPDDDDVEALLPPVTRRYRDSTPPESSQSQSSSGTVSSTSSSNAGMKTRKQLKGKGKQKAINDDAMEVA